MSNYKGGVPRPKTYVTTKGTLRNTRGQPNWFSKLNRYTMPEQTSGHYKYSLKKGSLSRYQGGQTGQRLDTLMGKKIPGGWGRIINKKNINKALPYVKKTMSGVKTIAGPGKIVGLATGTAALLKEAFGFKKAY